MKELESQRRGVSLICILTYGSLIHSAHINVVMSGIELSQKAMTLSVKLKFTFCRFSSSVLELSDGVEEVSREWRAGLGKVVRSMVV